MNSSLYFLVDVPCAAAPNELYKKGNVYQIRESRTVGFLKNKQARLATKEDLKEKTSAKKPTKDSSGK